LVVDVEPGRFEEMVITALDGLPEDLGQLMRNVAVTMAPGRLACSGSTRASR
jgi:predicted Zn-dependent protease with MMP-like domain